jgi:hypothetical protein
MSFATLFVCFFLGLCAVSSGTGLGDRLVRSFGIFAELPLTATEATAEGWVLHTSRCDPKLGFLATQGPVRCVDVDVDVDVDIDVVCIDRSQHVENQSACTTLHQVN